MDNKQTKKLIEMGSDLVEKAREYSIKNHKRGDIYKMAELILFDYRSWKDDVIKFLKQSKADEIIIHNITSSDTLFINPSQWAAKAIDPKTKTKAIKLFIENVGKIIKELSVASSAPPEKLNINEVSLDFNKNKSIIIFNNQKIRIPTNSKENEFCKNLFKMKIGDYVSWDLFYNTMDEEKDMPDKKDKKALRDTINRVNEKLKEHFKDNPKLAKFERKNIIRLH